MAAYLKIFKRQKTKFRIVVMDMEVAAVFASASSVIKVLLY